MEEIKYTFMGKDVTEQVLSKITETIIIISNQLGISFDDAEMLFNSSKMYENVLISETGLWSQSAEYIADHFFEEIGIKS